MTVPDHEHDSAEGFDLPAVYVNRFRVRVGFDITRIAFGEATGPGADPHYRVAIALPTAEAVGLADLLRKLADQLQERLKATAGAGTHGEKPN